MKKMIVLVALALAAPAWAQAPAQKKEPPKTEAQKPKPAAVAKKSRRSEDARHCLERASNTEIIKCAEEYL